MINSLEAISSCSFNLSLSSLNLCISFSNSSLISPGAHVLGKGCNSKLSETIT